MNSGRKRKHGSSTELNGGLGQSDSRRAEMVQGRGHCNEWDLVTDQTQKDCEKKVTDEHTIDVSTHLWND